MAEQTEPTSPPSANQQGNLNIASGGDTTVGGDVVGRDKITINVPAPGAPVKYATRADYLAQIIDRHQDLEFVGIPELKDRQALRIEDVFINLQAEVEIGWDDIIQKTIETPPSAPITSEQALAWATTGPVLEHVAKHYSPEKVKRRVSANEVLRKHQRLVILGDPGVGKTTLLKYITVAFSQKQSGKLGLHEERLPIFVRLYDYVAKKAERREDYSLIRYLYTQAEEHLLLKLEPSFFESELERGNCCVCLDGLDELGGAGLRREVTNAVASLANRYPRNRFIVTSRRVGYEEAPLDRREFVHHTVLPLTDDDIREFVKKWYAAREKDPASARERAEHLTKTIMDEPRIKSLAANPLMLTIIALVHRIEAELPHERVKLYDKCVTALVETWEKVKGLTVEDRERPSYKYRRRLLEQLAFWIHSQPGAMGRAREVKEGDLELQLTRFLLDNPKLQLDDESARQEAQAFIALAKSRTGLLVERGERVYSFAHLTFQEYLAAADIEHRLAHSIDAIWDEIRSRLHDPHWREAILLLLGSLNKFDRHPTELVRRILKRRDKYETVLHRHLFFSARVLADRVEVEAQLRDHIVGRLLKIARTDPFAWADALDALGSLDDDLPITNGLLDLANDKRMNEWMRLIAAKHLGRLGHVDFATSILLALVHEGQIDSEVKTGVALTLNEIGRVEDAIGILLAIAFDKHANAKVRYDAVRSIIDLGYTERIDRSNEVADVLLSIAQNRQAESWLRRDAAESLGKLGQPQQAIDILKNLAIDPNTFDRTRPSTASVVAKLGQNAEAISILQGMFHNEELGADVRMLASEFLRDLGWQEIDTLLQRMKEEEWDHLLDQAKSKDLDASMRVGAIIALRDLGINRKEVLSELLGLGGDKTVDARVRIAVARTLVQLDHGDSAADILASLARNKKTSARMRRSAAQSLAQLGRVEDASVLLLNMIYDRDLNNEVRNDAARVLGSLGYADENTLLGLLSVTRDQGENELVRRAAYDSLKALLGA